MNSRHVLKRLVTVDNKLVHVTTKHPEVLDGRSCNKPLFRFKKVD
jgi:hypothetical protein